MHVPCTCLIFTVKHTQFPASVSLLCSWMLNSQVPNNKFDAKIYSKHSHLLDIYFIFNIQDKKLDPVSIDLFLPSETRKLAPVESSNILVLLSWQFPGDGYWLNEGRFLRMTVISFTTISGKIYTLQVNSSCSIFISFVVC